MFEKFGDLGGSELGMAEFPSTFEQARGGGEGAVGEVWESNSLAW